MSFTSNFRQQHEELQEIAGQIARALHADRLAKDGAPARQLLTQLAGKLKIHLAMEDKQLYPLMLASPDPAVQSAAIAFQREMGGLAPVFGGYIVDWPNAEAIERDSLGFVQETQGILRALNGRISREHAELDDLAGCAR